jgi:hypothetical protein
MKLGNLEKVDLREVWKHEALDFTKWLSKEDNISLLLDEVGITAENIVTEDRAGNFNVDITADEIQTGKKIVIENQLEKTDHSHLGQLLTYASSFDACIIIWVVASTREEHRRAIEWFNEHMNDEISFFLVKTEVYKIGDSKPAVKFDVVVEPNSWSKIAKNRAFTEKAVSETKIRHLNFWENLKDFSSSFNNSLRITRTPRHQHWYDISIGTSGIHISLTRNTRDSYVGSEIWISDNKPIYDKLYLNKDKFEEVVGDNVKWNELEGKKASRIQCLYSCDPDNTDRHDEYYKWMIETSEKLIKAFYSII